MAFFKVRKIFRIVLFGLLVSHAMHVHAAFFSLDTLKHFGSRITMCLGYGKRQATSLGAKFCAAIGSIGRVGNRCYRSCAFWSRSEHQEEAFQPKNVPEDLNEDIHVGNSACKGCEVQIGEDVVAQQISVLDQGNLSGDCAYHALKNATEIAEAVSQDAAGNLQEQVCSAEKAQNLFRRSAVMRFIGAIMCYPFERTGSWRSIVKNMPDKQCRDTDWLQCDEVEHLIVNADNVSPDHVTVIDDTYLLGNAAVVTDEVRNKIARCKEQNILGADYVHAFVLGTMNGRQSYESCQKGLSSGNGHWITVVVQQKDGKRNYIVADSKNAVRLLGEPFKKLIRELEGEEVAANISEMRRNVGQGALKLIPEEYSPDGVLEAAGSILPLLKRDPQSISQDQVELKERVKQSIGYVSTLLPRFERDYSRKVESDFESNFRGYDFDCRRCYEALGFSSSDAENISLEDVQAVRRRKIEEEPDAPNGVSIWRQMGYLFSNPLMKQDYDAFIKGPNAVLRLQQHNPVEHKQLQEKYTKLLSCQADLGSIVQERLEEVS